MTKTTLWRFIDWEFVFTVPTWFAAALPSILFMRDYKEPIIAQYYPFSPDGQYCSNEVECYWSNVRYYSSTVLRDLFFAEMERISPEWTMEYKEGKQKREFMELVRSAEKLYMFLSVGMVGGAREGGVNQWAFG
ncbi:hypothetical protein IAT40_006590 [Kwoniella sp. CBS 6097]